jgi:phage host-nuclease inhibitor protein Gam
MLEALFALRAIANDKDFVEDFILDDELQRLKMLNKLKQLEPEIKQHLMDDFTEQDFDNEIAKLKDEIDNREIKRISTESLSKKAGLHNHYLTAYSLLSSTVHSKIRDLEYYLRTDETGDISRFEWGPNVKGIEKVLFQASELAVFTLEAMLEVFGLNIRAATDEFVRRYQELGKTI